MDSTYAQDAGARQAGENRGEAAERMPVMAEMLSRLESLRQRMHDTRGSIDNIATNMIGSVPEADTRPAEEAPRTGGALGEAFGQIGKMEVVMTEIEQQLRRFRGLA